MGRIESKEKKSIADCGARNDGRERLLLAASLEQADELVSIAETDGTISYVNPAFARFTGRSFESVVGLHFDDVFKASADFGRAQQQWERIKKGKRRYGRFRRRTPDGEIVETAASITPIADPKNPTKTDAFIIFERDLSRDVRIKQQMRQSRKMESLGTLAGGIAHDLNNILMPIVLNAELLLEQMDETSGQRAAIEKILNAAHRGRDLVKQVVTFSREGEEEQVPVQLSPLIKEATKLIRASLPADIEIRSKLEPSSRRVIANPSQIHQVLLNLCSNAADAIGNRRGNVEIRLEEVLLDHAGAAELSLDSGRHLRLTVADDGGGIETVLLGKIFEPFFTTKSPGRGTGMGLAMVHGIVTRHNGTVTVESTVGRGSVFSVYLPCVESPEPTDIPMDKRVPRGEGRILLVDDDAQIRDTVTEVLEGLGYTVQSMGDPEKALGRFRADPSAFDLLLTDQTMREMKGTALSRAVHRIRPAIPVIICTGHIDYVGGEPFKQEGPTSIVMKPLSRGELARAVSRALMPAIEGRQE